jgi:hypothetical protein
MNPAPDDTTSPADWPAQVSLPDDVLYEMLEDEAVLLNLSTEHYFTLDDVGTRMWQLLVEHRHPDRVVEAMLAEYATDEATVRRDLANLLAQLLDQKLLVRAE